MSPRSKRKPALGQRSTSKKQVTSLSSKREPVIWSRDTGQQIPCFDRCQLTITWMSNIKEGGYKSRLHFSVSLLAGVWLAPCATPWSSSSFVRVHEQYPSDDNHEKNNLWASFSFPYEYGAPLGGPSGRRSSAITSTSLCYRLTTEWKKTCVTTMK